jgi:hypothetical protein
MVLPARATWLDISIVKSDALTSVSPAMEHHTPISFNGKSYIKTLSQIVHLIVQKNPRKIGFSEVFFAQFDVQFDVQ